LIVVERERLGTTHVQGSVSMRTLTDMGRLSCMDVQPSAVSLWRRKIGIPWKTSWAYSTSPANMI